VAGGGRELDPLGLEDAKGRQITSEQCWLNRFRRLKRGLVATKFDNLAAERL
jgi:hypothetical protein